jgi:hypothetical protein
MTASNDPNITQRLLATRLVASALMLGLLFMAGMALFVVHFAGNKIGGGGGFPVISAIAAGCFVVVGSSLFVIVPAMNRGQLRLLKDKAAIDAGKLLSLWNTSTTVLFGLLEGPSLFGLMAYLLEHEPFVLAVPGFGLLLMLAFFPTEGRFHTWLERQRTALEEMKQSGNLGE